MENRSPFRASIFFFSLQRQYYTYSNKKGPNFSIQSLPSGDSESSTNAYL